VDCQKVHADIKETWWCLKGVSGKVIVDEKEIKDSWKDYMEKLMNKEVEPRLWQVESGGGGGEEGCSVAAWCLWWICWW